MLMPILYQKYPKILYDEFNHNDFTTDTTIDWWMNDVIRKYDILFIGQSLF